MHTYRIIFGIIAVIVAAIPVVYTIIIYRKLKVIAKSIKESRENLMELSTLSEKLSLRYNNLKAHIKICRCSYDVEKFDELWSTFIHNLLDADYVSAKQNLSLLEKNIDDLSCTFSWKG